MTQIIDNYIQSGALMSRTLLITFCSGVALGFYNNLSHVIAVTGAISCTPIAFTLPALFHLKLGLARSAFQSKFNIFVVILSFIIFCFTLEEVLRTWYLNTEN